MDANERMLGGLYPQSVFDSPMAPVARQTAALSVEPGGGRVEANADQRMEQTFPSKLHYMLDPGLEENEKSIITWQPHGRAFVVLDQARFVAELLPNWFRQNKYQSFQRQLNSYGFQRITQGRDKGAYYHMHFLRGRPELCRRIKRVKIKGNGGRKPSNPEAEPNFYIFPPIPPPSQDDGPGSMSKLYGPTASGEGVEVIGKGGSSFTSLQSSPPSTLDSHFARLMASGNHRQSISSSSSFVVPSDERKAQTQDSARMFVSNVKNGMQPQWRVPTHTLLERSTLEARHSQSVAPLPVASYAQAATMGAAAPPLPTASGRNALQRSLMLEYSRRLEMEAQAIDRERQLLSLLARQHRSFPTAIGPPPASLSLMRLLERVQGNPQPEEEKNKRSEN